MNNVYRVKWSIAENALLALRILAIATTLTFPQLANAQITPDSSLGPNLSVVVPESATRDRIEGGVTSNTNLFHSFQDFSIAIGQEVYFANPIGIETILTRVTGTNSSAILGTLGVLGNADFFLLNPNGIIFGSKSQLDISGSFTASTAESFEWEDGSKFSAINPAIPPILTVNLTPGIQQGLSEQSTDIIQSGQLMVGQDLNFVARNIDLQGQIAAEQDITLRASDTVQLRDVSGSSFGIIADRNITIDADNQIIIKDAVLANDISITTGSLRVTDGGQLLISPREGELGDVHIAAIGTITIEGENAQDVSSIKNRGPSGDRIDSGDISIIANRLELLNGAIITATTQGEGDSGKVAIEVNGTTLLAGEDSIGFGSGIFSAVNSTASGDSQGIFLTTGTLIIRDGGEISATSRGQGSAGPIKIIVRGTTSLNGFSSNGFESGIFSNTDLFRGNSPDGDAGNIFISTGSLSLTNNAFISANAFGTGKAGTITIQARDDITLIGNPASNAATGNSVIITQVADTAASPEGGNISITARSLNIINGGFIGASTFGEGNAGTITINASESISLEGTDNRIANGILSGVSFGATGSGGEIKITTDLLSLSNAAEIRTLTLGNGRGGNITINANRLEITTAGKLSSSTFSDFDAGSIELKIVENLTINGENSGIFADADVGSTGDAGSIVIDPRLVNLQDGATIGVRSLGTGIGGNIRLVADQIRLNDNSSISAETVSDQGGNISLLVDDVILLRNNSNVSATAGTTGAEGDGGNVTIDTNFLVSPFDEDNNITANADLGRGGRIQITALGVYGIEKQTNEIPVRNDITASSNANLDGEVNINAFTLDPTRDTIRLPSDTGTLVISQRCNPSQGNASFVATGRGGIPLGPEDTIASQDLWEELHTLRPETTTAISPSTQFPSPKPALTEAQGWTRNADGNVELVAITNSARTISHPAICSHQGHLSY